MHSFKASIAILFVASHLAIAAPVPDTTNQVNNAYSGGGGHAIGGSVTHNTISGTRLLGGGTGLLKIFSGISSVVSRDIQNIHLPERIIDNAGNGGRANSRPSVAGTPSNLRVGMSTSANNADGNISNTVGNAYSGVGGIADGGPVSGAGDALIDVFSGKIAAMT